MAFQRWRSGLRQGHAQLWAGRLAVTVAEPLALPEFSAAKSRSDGLQAPLDAAGPNTDGRRALSEPETRRFPLSRTLLDLDDAPLAQPFPNAITDTLPDSGEWWAYAWASPVECRFCIYVMTAGGVFRKRDWLLH